LIIRRRSDDQRQGGKGKKEPGFHEWCELDAPHTEIFNSPI
jgi:hypothetical protein